MAGRSSFVSGKPFKILLFSKCRVGSQISLSQFHWVADLERKGSGWYEVVTRHSSFLGADAKGFGIIKTRAFWSVCRMTFLTNTYWWLCSMPKTGNKNYFSILEYFLSANGSVTGSPCCISKISSLFLDASPSPYVGFPFLKYLSSGAFFEQRLWSLWRHLCGHESRSTHIFSFLALLRLKFV